MADPDDKTRHEGVSTDGRPRRQPPIIDVEAVEVSLDGSRTGRSLSGARRSLKRILTFRWPTKLLPPVKFAIIGSVCFIAAIVAGALWIYLAPDGIDGPQRSAARPEAAVPNDVIEPIARPEVIVTAPPSRASADKDLASRVAAFDAMLASLGDRITALE